MKTLGSNNAIRVKAEANKVTVEHIESGEESEWGDVINSRSIGDYDLTPKDMKLLYSVDAEVDVITGNEPEDVFFPLDIGAD